jgi:hypothetical protein
MKKNLLAFVMLCCMAVSSAADVPQKVSFQTVLNEDGSFLSGDKNVDIGFYTSSDVSPIWVQSYTDYTFVNGLLSVTLGSTDAIPVSALLNDTSRIGITVEGSIEPVFVTMTAVPFSIVSRYAETVVTASSSVVGGVRIGDGLSIDDDGIVSVSSSVTTENIQDAVFGQVLSGAQTGISVSYDDDNDVVTYVVETQSDENFTSLLMSKLDGIEESADVNQNAFGSIVAGSGSYSAAAVSDELTIVGDGSNISTALSGSTLTISLAAGGDDSSFQNVWETFQADEGSASAQVVSDTFNIYGDGLVTTAISDDTLTISVTLEAATASELGGVKVADASAIDIDTDGFLTLDTTGLQSSDDTLTALASVSAAADTLIYATGEDAFGTTTLTSQARLLLDDADASTMRTTLGLGTAATSAASAFQSADDNLTRLSGQSAPSNGQLLIGNASNGYSVAAITAGDGISITNGNGSITIASDSGLDLTALDSDIIGDTDNTYDLGSSSSAFASAYITTATISSLNISSTDKVRNLNADTLDGEEASAFQDVDATLTALAGVSTAADTLIYATGEDAFGTTTLTSQARLLLDDADAATMRTTLGLGTAATSAASAFQSADDNLTRLSGQSAPSNGQLLIGNASNGYSVATITAGDGINITNGNGSITIESDSGVDLTALDSDIIGDTDNTYDLGSSTSAFASAYITTATISSLNISSTDKVRNLNADTLDGEEASAFQDVDATLTALSGVSTAADTLIYATGEDTFGTTTLTSQARLLLDDADASTMRTTLGLGTAATSAASAFQSADDNLTRLSGQSAPSNGQLLIGNASSGYSIATITAGDGISITNGNGSITIASDSGLDLTALGSDIIGDTDNTYDLGSSTSAFASAYITTATISSLNISSTDKVRNLNADTLDGEEASAFQDVDATLTALAGVSTAADTLIYATGEDTFGTTTLTSQARLLLDDADAATMRTTLGLGTAATSASSAFQSADDNLTRLSGQSAPSNGQLLIGNASNEYSVASLTAGEGISITNGSGSISIASSGWGLSGNSGTTEDTNFIGTTDETDLYIKVNNVVVTRYQTANASFSQSIVSGYSANSITSTVYGSTIAGGGTINSPNTIYDNFGFIGGGVDNVIGSNSSTSDDEYAVITGGRGHLVDGEFGTILGGKDNSVKADYGTALGVSAVVDTGHDGAFVFNAKDSVDQDLYSSAAGEFTVMAQGGVRLSVKQSSQDPATAYTMYMAEGTDSVNVAIGGAVESGVELKVHGEAVKTDGSQYWDTSSDRRLKKEILPIENALERLLALSGKTYYWIEPEQHGGHAEQQLGFIAQEMQTVFPDWVKQGSDGYLKINPAGINALTVEAIRVAYNELKEENESLKAQLQAFEARFQALESRLD